MPGIDEWEGAERREGLGRFCGSLRDVLGGRCGRPGEAPEKLLGSAAKRLGTLGEALRKPRCAVGLPGL
eukprot:15307968-Alexandrium_andersonii.AAC.1